MESENKFKDYQRIIKNKMKEIEAKDAEKIEA